MSWVASQLERTRAWIPAFAGMTASKGKIKMGLSVRWDDGYLMGLQCTATPSFWISMTAFSPIAKRKPRPM